MLSRILVTGANGFLGANLIKKLSQKNNQIIIFSTKKSSNWRLNHLKIKVETHIVDLTKGSQVKNKIKEIRPDIAYHCAVYGVYPFQNNLSKMIRTNIIGSVNLMDALSELDNFKKIINIGSSFEYGYKNSSIKETEKENPPEAYSITKNTQTHFAKYFAEHKNLSIVTLRVFNVYGMYEEPGRLMADIMLALVKKSTLKLYSPSIRRDFIFIDDVIDAIMKATKSPKHNGEIFNIGSGQDYSVLDVVNTAKKVTNVNLDILFEYNKRKFDKTNGRLIANIEKASKILDWKPKNSLEEGILKTFNWYKKNSKFFK